MEEEETSHRVEEGRNQTGEEVIAYQIVVEVAKNHYCLLEAGVRVSSSHLVVVEVGLPRQVGAAESYLVFRSFVVQVSFLERVLKTPYVLLEVVVWADFHSDLQVEVVRVHCGILEVEAMAQYALRQALVAGVLMMKNGPAVDRCGPQGFVVMQPLFEVLVEGNLDEKVDQRTDRGQEVEAPFDLEGLAAALRRTQTALGEENPDVHWEQEGD